MMGDHVAMVTQVLLSEGKDYCDHTARAAPVYSPGREHRPEVIRRRGQTYREEDPLTPPFLLGGIFKKAFRGVQEPEEVESSFFIAQKQQGGLIQTLRVEEPYCFQNEW